MLGNNSLHIAGTPHTSPIRCRIPSSCLKSSEIGLNIGLRKTPSQAPEFGVRPFFSEFSTSLLIAFKSYSYLRLSNLRITDRCQRTRDPDPAPPLGTSLPSDNVITPSPSPSLALTRYRRKITFSKATTFASGSRKKRAKFVSSSQFMAQYY